MKAILYDNLMNNKHGESVGEQINYVYEYVNGLRPIKPKKPFLDKNHNAEELQSYIKEFNEYENRNKEYNEYILLYKEVSIASYDALERYIYVMSGVNTIPEIYRDKVINFVKSRKDGYLEIFNELMDICEEIF